MRFRNTVTAALQVIVLMPYLAVTPVASTAQVSHSGCPLHRRSPSPAPVRDHECCRSGNTPAIVQRVVLPTRDAAPCPVLKSSHVNAPLPDLLNLFPLQSASASTPTAILQLRI